MSEQDIRVMLVDDQELLRTGFRLILLAESDIEVVAEAANGAEALAEMEHLAQHGGCDVILMDVRMPVMNGIDATAAIVERFPDTRVLVLTTFDLDEYATAAVQAGASGFLLKDARPSELTDAIRRVAAGDAAMAPSVMRRLLEQLRASSPIAQTETQPPTAVPPQTVEGGAPPVPTEVLSVLTERELEVLRLIATGMNNAEISAALFLSESTVKTHVGRVLAKLQLRDRVHAVILAKQQGL